MHTALSFFVSWMQVVLRRNFLRRLPIPPPDVTTSLALHTPLRIFNTPTDVIPSAPFLTCTGLCTLTAHPRASHLLFYFFFFFSLGSFKEQVVRSITFKETPPPPERSGGVGKMNQLASAQQRGGTVSEMLFGNNFYVFYRSESLKEGRQEQ